MNNKLKNGLFTLLAVPVIVAPTIALFGCDAGITLSYISNKTEAAIELIEKSTYFENDFNVSVYQGKSGSSYNKKGEIVALIPNYDSANSGVSINDKINQNSQNGEISSPYVKLRMIYDAIWGYSYKIISENAKIMNNIKINSGVSKDAQSAIDKLDEDITNFRSEVANQENELRSLKLYLYDIGEAKWETSVAYNAVYNYEKTYKAFVKAGLNLAISSTHLVDLVYDNVSIIELNPVDNSSTEELSEESLTRKVSTKNALNILKIYYKFLVEENVSNFSENGAYVDFYNKIYTDYLDFVASLFNGLSNEANYSARLKRSEISTLNDQEKVILEQYVETKNIFGRFDLKSFVINNKGDESKLSIEQKHDYTMLKVFYRDILRTWWENVVTILFTTGVIN